MVSILHPLRGRCRAWRPAPRPDGHPVGHEPGSCRACWHPCFEHRREGTDFCSQCWLLLAAHPADRVRGGVAARRDVPLDVLEDLAGDSSAPVAYGARDRLEEITDRSGRKSR